MWLKYGECSPESDHGESGELLHISPTILDSVRISQLCFFLFSSQADEDAPLPVCTCLLELSLKDSVAGLSCIAKGGGMEDKMPSCLLKFVLSSAAARPPVAYEQDGGCIQSACGGPTLQRTVETPSCFGRLWLTICLLAAT